MEVLRGRRPQMLLAEDTEKQLELFFSQSLEGFFFMMLDEPVPWNETVDKEEILDYVFSHQRITRVNDAMLEQYRATRDSFIGLTPAQLYRHDPGYGRRIWREFFDRGRLHVETEERRLDESPMWIEGDYICLHDGEGCIAGHFGIQRDITERKQSEEALRRYHHRLLVLRDTDRDILAARSAEEIAQATLRRFIDLIPCQRTSVALFDLDEGTARLLALESALPTQLGIGTVVSLSAFAAMEVLRQGRAHLVADVNSESSYAVIESLRAEGFRSYLSVPLLAQGKLTGSLNAASVAVGAFAEEHVEIALEFANNLAVAIQQARLRSQVERYAAALEDQIIYLQEDLKSDRNWGEMIGVSPAMQSVFKSIEMVAGTDSTVLLLGETGTGKELIARAIHNLSPRHDAVMMKVNCGALPAGLVESELFGHERGAFTGATQQKKGRFELAHHGTLFLDEVGELPPEVQVKLLRVLQEQEFERVGGIQTIRVNARVIAATNRDLNQAVQQGRFRADLFYRLNIFPIPVPPLRERRDDIPLLATQFINAFSRRLGRSVDRISRKAMERLTAYDWPGNVRELANVLERAVILCDGHVLQSSHLGTLNTSLTVAHSFLTLEELERQHILKALEKTEGVLAGPHGAAHLLGMNRSTLWSRMKKHGILYSAKSSA
jgi:formate hydrogenlyase transcriptional activator